LLIYFYDDEPQISKYNIIITSTDSYLVLTILLLFHILLLFSIHVHSIFQSLFLQIFLLLNQRSIQLKKPFLFFHYIGILILIVFIKTHTYVIDLFVFIEFGLITLMNTRFLFKTPFRLSTLILLNNTSDSLPHRLSLDIPNVIKWLVLMILYLTNPSFLKIMNIQYQHYLFTEIYWLPSTVYILFLEVS